MLGAGGGRGARPMMSEDLILPKRPAVPSSHDNWRLYATAVEAARIDGIEHNQRRRADESRIECAELRAIRDRCSQRRRYAVMMLERQGEAVR